MTKRPCVSSFKSLRELYDAMTCGDSRVLDKYGQWRADLPVFGGEEISDSDKIWSWDQDNVIHGTCQDDLQIIPRDLLFTLEDVRFW